MDMSPREYQAYIKKKQDPSPLVKNVVIAFVVGGAICVIGQLLTNGFKSMGLDTEDAGTATSISLVFLSAVLIFLSFPALR